MAYPRFSPYGVDDDSNITWPNFAPGSTDVSSPEIPQGVGTTTAPLPQQVLPPSISPDRMTMQDRLRGLYDTDSPALTAYKAHLATMPENNPGIMTRIGAGLSGAAAGFEHPGSGFRVAQEQLNAPYERDMASWNNKGKRLGEAANLEDKGIKEKVALIKQDAAERKEAEREKTKAAEDDSIMALRRKEIENYDSLIDARKARPDAVVSVDQQNKAITAAARALNLESGGKYSSYINEDGTIKSPDQVGGWIDRFMSGANKEDLAKFYKATQERADAILGKPRGKTGQTTTAAPPAKESTATSAPSSRIVAAEGVSAPVGETATPQPPKVKVAAPPPTMPVPQQPIMTPKVAPQPTLPQEPTPLPPPNIPAPMPQAAAPIEQAPPQPNIPPPDYGNRFNSNDKKGQGFLGPLQRPDGSGVMTEYSIGVQLNGKETEIPTLVPTLTKEEVSHILTMKPGDKMPDSIVQKAVNHAKQRMAEGKDVFAGPGEQGNSQPNIPAPVRPPMMASHGPTAPPMAISHGPNIPPPMPQQMPQEAPQQVTPPPPQREFVGPRDFMGPRQQPTPFSGPQDFNGPRQQSGPSPNVKAPTFEPQQPKKMEVNEDTFNAIKAREGFQEKAKQDVKGPAVGYGMHTWQGKPVTAGMRVTKEQADAELVAQINSYYKPLIDRNLKVPINQKQYNELISVAWNLPSAALGLIKRLNAGQKLTEQDFRASATIKGKPSAGLAKRRTEEASAFVE